MGPELGSTALAQEPQMAKKAILGKELEEQKVIGLALEKVPVSGCVGPPILCTLWS